jgi:hypothetical protein
MNPAIFERLQIPVYWDISVASLPFDSLNRMASHYFVGLRYAREELPTVFTEGPNETQILYDAETDRAYLVTAPTGAAVRDIMNITRRRNPYVQLILYPAKVQVQVMLASAAPLCMAVRS